MAKIGWVSRSPELSYHTKDTLLRVWECFFDNFKYISTKTVAEIWRVLLTLWESMHSVLFKNISKPSDVEDSYAKISITSVTHGITQKRLHVIFSDDANRIYVTKVRCASRCAVATTTSNCYPLCPSGNKERYSQIQLFDHSAMTHPLYFSIAGYNGSWTKGTKTSLTTPRPGSIIYIYIHIAYWNGWIVMVWSESFNDMFCQYNFHSEVLGRYTKSVSTWLSIDYTHGFAMLCF